MCNVAAQLLFAARCSWRFVGGMGHSASRELDTGAWQTVAPRFIVIALRFVHAVLVGKPESNISAGNSRGVLVVSKAQREWGQEPVPRDNARSLARGRGVLFVDTLIAYVGVAQSFCWESPKPTEFGTAGQYWENIGWKVRVQFTPVVQRVRPKDHMRSSGPWHPPGYGPLQANGDGKQGVYLTELPLPFAEVLSALIGAQAQSLIAGAAVGAPIRRTMTWIGGSTGWKPQLKPIFAATHGARDF